MPLAPPGAAPDAPRPAALDAPPPRDGSRVVVVFIALTLLVAAAMITLRFQDLGHGDMGADVSEDMPVGSH